MIKDWKKFNESVEENPDSFKTKEEFITYWSDKFGNVKDFPAKFIEAFQNADGYSDFEKDKYDYQDEDDEFNFDPDDEVYNIGQEFNIDISEDGDITTEDWVDFFNSAWTW